MKKVLLGLSLIFSLSAFSSTGRVVVDKLKVYDSLPNYGLETLVSRDYVNGNVIGYLYNGTEINVLKEELRDYKNPNDESFFSTTKGKWLKVSAKNDGIELIGYIFMGYPEADTRFNVILD